MPESLACRPSGDRDGVSAPLKLDAKLPLLPGVPVLADRGVELTGYRGGVTYFVFVVGGGVARGSRPIRRRWAAFRSTSGMLSACE